MHVKSLDPVRAPRDYHGHRHSSRGMTPPTGSLPRCLPASPGSPAQPPCCWEEGSELSCEGALLCRKRGATQNASSPATTRPTTAGRRLRVERCRGGCEGGTRVTPVGSKRGPPTQSGKTSQQGSNKTLPGASDRRAPDTGFCWKGRGRQASHMSRVAVSRRFQTTTPT